MYNTYTPTTRTIQMPPPNRRHYPTRVQRKDAERQEIKDLRVPSKEERLKQQQEREEAEIARKWDVVSPTGFEFFNKENQTAYCSHLAHIDHCPLRDSGKLCNSTSTEARQMEGMTYGQALTKMEAPMWLVRHMRPAPPVVLTQPRQATLGKFLTS